MTARGWLESRSLEPEVMDDPALEAGQHQQALSALRRINFLSASASIVWPAIRQLAQELKTDRLRVLDIATGSGDVPIALWQKARRAGIHLNITGVDFSERAVNLARNRQTDHSVPIRFERLDVLNEPLPKDHDVVMCSLFLHHLTDHDARRLIHSMATAARHLVLISDLRRSRYGWCLAYAASRLLTRSKVVHTDALLSVQGAFTMDELAALATDSPLREGSVTSHWPCRMLLTGRTRSAHP